MENLFGVIVMAVLFLAALVWFIYTVRKNSRKKDPYSRYRGMRHSPRYSRYLQDKDEDE
jgi:hypothetical protein